MQSAPAWVTYASLTAAVIALTLSFLSYRANLPRPAVRLLWERFPTDPDDRPLDIRVLTRGGGEIEVTRLYFTVPSRLSVYSVSIERHHLTVGEVPGRIRGRSSITYVFSPAVALLDHLQFLRLHSQDVQSVPARLLARLRHPLAYRVYVVLGNGCHVRAPRAKPFRKLVRRYMAEELARREAVNA